MSQLIYLDRCISTQDEIVSLLLSSPKNFSGVFTFKQTGGRGQYGNSWNDTVGKGIAISFGLKKNVKTLSDSLFNFYTALALRDFVANMTRNDVYIKWPNDLIIKDKKIAGLLIEKQKINNEAYFIIGIGINLLQMNFDEIAKAGSLLSTTGITFGLERFSKKLFEYLEEKLQENVSPSAIIPKYHQFLFKKDRIAVFEKNKVRQNGIIKKVDEEGFLWIDLENEGLQKFYHKEISMLY